jgi:hypothetical protein
MTTEPVRGTREMLSGMTPSLDTAEYVFCTTADVALANGASHNALAWFREDEGFSLVLEIAQARRFGFDCALPMRRITLTVFSSLEGIGLTAAVSDALTRDGIPCNMVAAYHHDHVFVPSDKAERAMAVLIDLQAASA